MKQIQLANPLFEGHNNVYVIGAQKSSPTVLIDTGTGTSQTQRTLSNGLSELGIGFEDVDEVLVTHFHSDHAGLAGLIQDESNAQVQAHQADAPLVRRDKDAIESFETERRSLIRQWDVPKLKLSDLYKYVQEHNAYAGPKPVVTNLSPDRKLAFGSTILRTIHLPGHTAGQCGFVTEGEDGTGLFCGDALLPDYTPNVGGTDIRLQRPLEKYLQTLQHIIDSGYHRVWPGHREVIESPTERAREIVSHHRLRAEQIYRTISEDGPLTVWGLSTYLFGDLEGIHIMAGAGEVYAHLNHLEENGIVESIPSGYVTQEPPDEIDALFS